MGLRQHSIRSGNYHYEPRDPISRERYSTPPHQAPPPTLVPRDRTDDRSRDQKPGWQKKDSRKPKTPKDDKGDHKDREHNHDHH